ncbi:MAG: TetR/AcrR family transcriptional regulator, partial [Actinobacteria bacterium]|nr:TetR/AcrR family transcriptional regulator [Actinomycetota bacterium]
MSIHSISGAGRVAGGVVVRYRAGLETQERILAATRALLAEGSLEGITLKGICERAGVLPGSFYNLFETKEEAVVT